MLIIKTCDLSPIVCRTFGFGDSATGVYLFFVFFGLSMLIVQIIIKIVTVVRTMSVEGRVKPIVMRNTGQAPELSLAQGEHFHLCKSCRSN